MQKYIHTIAVSLLVLTGCKEAETNIVIKASLQNLPCKKLYLTDAHSYDKFLDSIEYKADGNFVYTKVPKEGFTPFSANFSYIDSTDGKLKALVFRNHIKSPSGTLKYLYHAFVIQPGITEMKWYNNDTPYISIDGSDETDAMYYTQMMDFGFINEQVPAKRKAILNGYGDVIRKYPDSYYLFKEIYSNSVAYNKQELQDILKLFGKGVIHSPLGQQFDAYVANMDDRPLDYLSQSFKTAGGISQPIIDTSSRLTLLVFWASWCSPCRTEIPLLKKMYRHFKRAEVNIVSISTDKDAHKWQKAMQEEQMPWPQLIADSAAMNSLGPKFKFSAIPCLIVVDKTGKEVYRTMGFDAQKPDGQKIDFIRGLL
jgi:thiol-disulfide isomerase/thioredoxin